MIKDITKKGNDEKMINLALKIDFENAYKNLDRNLLDGFEEKMPTLRTLSELQFISKSKEVSGVPFGGVPFAHPIANILLMAKRKKIMNAFKNVGIKINAFITYADDSVMYISVPKNLLNGDKGLFNHDSKPNFAHLREIIEKHSKDFSFVGLKINIEKTGVFSMSNNTDVHMLKDSFYAIYSLNGMIEASKMFNKQSIEISGYEDSDILDRTTNMISRQRLLNDIRNLEKNLLWEKVSEIIEKIFSIKNAASMIINLFNVIYEKGKINEFACVFVEKIQNLNGEWKFGKKRFIKSDKETPFMQYIKNLLSDVSRSNSILKFLADKIYFELFGFNDDFSCFNIIERINSRNETEQSILDHALNNILTVYGARPSEYLWNLIIRISEMSQCDYQKIKLEFIYGINADKEDKIKNYYVKIKINLLRIANALFKGRETVLYERFKRAVMITKNRIELINLMKIISENKEISEINSMIITQEELSVFKIISSLINVYHVEDSFKKIDKAIISRMGVKLLWSNGSPSMHSYTMHNHHHGDALLIKYFEIWRDSISFRRFQQGGIDEYIFILSCYYHDIGMLKDMPYQSSFADDLGTIRGKVGDFIRKRHHKESGSILRDTIGVLFGLDFKEISKIDYVALYHGQLEETLPEQKCEDVKNSAITLALLDNFDISKNRSPMLPRLVTSNAASRTSFHHWIKHLAIEEISWTEFGGSIRIGIQINENVISKSSSNWENFIKFLVNNELMWISSGIQRYHLELAVKPDVSFEFKFVNGAKKTRLKMVDGNIAEINSFFRDDDVNKLPKNVRFINENMASFENKEIINIVIK